jgi:hypothetical protein
MLFAMFLIMLHVSTIDFNSEISSLHKSIIVLSYFW